jgi:hypothetical protein
VRDVGCDVVPEDLIDAESGGAGNLITDLLDGSGAGGSLYEVRGSAGRA